jgi:two-component system, OmpR family, response regulator NblR
MPSSTASSYILLVENDTALAEKIYVDLFKAGYQVFSSQNVQSSWSQIRQQPPQMIVVDRELPKDTALDFVRQLREQNYVMPILLLMAQDAIADRVACLESGADDYLVKPYHTNGFLQLLRFYLQVQPPSHQKIQFSDLVLDLDTRQALRGNRSISLTSKEFELLRYFMAHPGEVLTREKILENVWGYNFLGASNVIEVYIRYLRLKLHADSEKHLIMTVRGTGYVLREKIG